MPCLLLAFRGHSRGDEEAPPAPGRCCVHGGVAGGHALLLPSSLGLGWWEEEDHCALFQRLMTRLCSWWALCFAKPGQLPGPAEVGITGTDRGWEAGSGGGGGTRRPGLRVEGLGEAESKGGGLGSPVLGVGA